MKKTKINLVKGRKKMSLAVFKCNFLERMKGLMFSKKEGARCLLLLNFKKPVHFAIHSLFVFFPFIAVWTDDKSRVLCWKKVKPFTFRVPSPASGFFKLIEIPTTKNYSKKVKFFS